MCRFDLGFVHKRIQLKGLCAGKVATVYTDSCKGSILVN